MQTQDASGLEVGGMCQSTGHKVQEQTFVAKIKGKLSTSIINLTNNNTNRNIWGAPKTAKEIKSYMQHLLLADRVEFSCRIGEQETPLKPPWSSKCRWSKR